MAVKITGADRGTPAEQAGLAGATLLSIDGNEINDMLDYEFFSSGPKLELALVPELAGDEAVLYCDADMLFQRPLDALFNGPLPLYMGMAREKTAPFYHEYESLAYEFREQCDILRIFPTDRQCKFLRQLSILRINREHSH